MCRGVGKVGTGAGCMNVWKGEQRQTRKGWEETMKKQTKISDQIMRTVEWMPSVHHCFHERGEWEREPEASDG